MALFRSRRSTQTLNFPGFCTATRLLIHSVGWSTLIWVVLVEEHAALAWWLDLLQCDILQAGNRVLWIHLDIPSKFLQGERFVMLAVNEWTDTSVPRDLQPWSMHVLPSMIGHGALSRMSNFILPLEPPFRLTVNVYEPSGLTTLPSYSLIFPSFPLGPTELHLAAKYSTGLYRTLHCTSLQYPCGS